MAKKTKKEKVEQLIKESELFHRYLMNNPVFDFDVPDEVYMPWVRAIQELGGNI